MLLENDQMAPLDKMISVPPTRFAIILCSDLYSKGLKM